MKLTILLLLAGAAFWQVLGQQQDGGIPGDKQEQILAIFGPDSCKMSTHDGWVDCPAEWLAFKEKGGKPAKQLIPELEAKIDLLTKRIESLEAKHSGVGSTLASGTVEGNKTKPSWSPYAPEFIEKYGPLISPLGSSGGVINDGATTLGVAIPVDGSDCIWALEGHVLATPDCKDLF